MTAGHSEHETAVTAWLDRAARGTKDEIIDAFERGFAALWRRSHVTLGEVTLTAIVERVLHTASAEYPALASIVVDESGLRCEGLRTVADLRGDQVRLALQFVLVEFLTVLGELTAEILTPALHDELSKSVTEDDAR